MPLGTLFECKSPLKSPLNKVSMPRLQRFFCPCY
nr:MAG TPA: hypothetical protein [Caudoviricetes sp.]DAU54012.1 MAG TPA: hypothetical protein [Caudoviricetes sp.]